jgi:Bardet-Biedl syndrome 7 protein
VIEVPLKPLSQHERISSIAPELLDQLPWSTLKVSGSFSYAEAVNWCSHFVPNISQSQSESALKQTFYFKSCFTQTYLFMEVQQNSIVVRSDNISAITIVKDQLTNDANSKKIAIDIKAELNEESISHMLSLFNPIIIK